MLFEATILPHRGNRFTPGTFNSLFFSMIASARTFIVVVLIAASPTRIKMAGFLQNVALGDPAAMQRCIEKYGGLVWSIARRLTATKADAEDATQEVYLQIWMHANRFDDTLGSEAGFIATIARRRLINKFRKKAADPMIEIISRDDMENLPGLVDLSDHTELAIDADIAMSAMASLKPKHRAVLELGFVHGLSQPAIARRLQIPVGTVKSHMRRGLLRVRETLTGNGWQTTRPTRQTVGSEVQPIAHS